MQEKPRKKVHLVVWAVLAICVMGGWVAVELMRSYRAAMDAVKDRNAGVAKLAAQRLTGALREIDYIMRDVQDRVDPYLLSTDEGPDAEETARLNQVLLRKINSHPWLFAVGVMNAKGIFIASVNRNAPQEVGEDFSRREYFSYPARHPESNAFCSGAYMETTTGDTWFSCSRTIRKKSRPSFAGVVVSGLNGKYLHGLFDRPGFAKGGAIAVADASGRLIFRAPDVPGAVGRKSGFAELDRFQAGKAETMQVTGVSRLDGRERLFAFQKVESFPYTVVVSSPVEEDLRHWRVHFYSSVAGFVLIATLLLGISYLASRLLNANMRLKDQAAELERQALTDPLTGIGNRRHFFEQGRRELQRSMRTEKRPSLLMLDIDRFKGVNDTYGHDAGDAALMALCETTLATIRNIDVFARIGGEEFAVLLPETTTGQALIVAERLRKRLEGTAVERPGGKDFNFTVSIGVAGLTAEDSGLEALLKRADEALYEAKNCGRNRVCAAPG